MGAAGLTLLDTQALIWYVAGDDRLGPTARELIQDGLSDAGVLVSAISFCELAWLSRTGRLLLPVSPLAWRASVLAEGVREVPVDGEVAIAAAELPDFHKDPADRLIVASARDEGARLLTADRQILGWAGMLARVDARQ